MWTDLISNNCTSTGSSNVWVKETTFNSNFRFCRSIDHSSSGPIIVRKGSICDKYFSFVFKQKGTTVWAVVHPKDWLGKIELATWNLDCSWFRVYTFVSYYTRIIHAYITLLEIGDRNLFANHAFKPWIVDFWLKSVISLFLIIKKCLIDINTQISSHILYSINIQLVLVHYNIKHVKNSIIIALISNHISISCINVPLDINFIPSSVQTIVILIYFTVQQIQFH